MTIEEAMEKLENMEQMQCACPDCERRKPALVMAIEALKMQREMAMCIARFDIDELICKSARKMERIACKACQYAPYRGTDIDSCKTCGVWYEDDCYYNECADCVIDHFRRVME